MASQDTHVSVLPRARSVVTRRLRTRVKIVFRLPAWPHLETGGSPFLLEEGSAENLDRLHAEHPDEVNERKHRILRDRVTDPGEDVWVIVDDQGQQCGFACLAWTDHLMRKENVLIRVRPHQALLMDTYVLRAHRRRGAQSFAVLRRLAIAAERGRTEVRVAVDRTNPASLASITKLGAIPVGRIVTFRHFKRSVQLERLSPERLLPARRSRERRGG